MTTKGVHMAEMAKSFSLGDHVLAKDACYVIAEVGSNHDGDRQRAFTLIQESARAGANAVKFQLFRADRIAADLDFPETRLRDQFAKFGHTVRDLYKDNELPVAWLRELKACCKENGVDFLGTPFDEGSADLLAAEGVKAIKIASFEITHLPLLQHVAGMGLPILLSTGMASLDEIASALETIRGEGEERVALFHCGIGYPLPFSDVHLRAMMTLKRTFACPVGYSDHTPGWVVPVAAVSLGAELLEKHITMPDGKSPDHDFALDTKAFKDMVRAVRDAEAALGDGEKRVRPCEEVHYRRGRRSIYVVQDVKQGDLFAQEDLAVLRPGIGIAPGNLEKIVGKKAVRDIKAPALLQEGDWC